MQIKKMGKKFPINMGNNKYWLMINKSRMRYNYDLIPYFFPIFLFSFSNNILERGKIRN